MGGLNTKFSTGKHLSLVKRDSLPISWSEVAKCALAHKVTECPRRYLPRTTFAKEADELASRPRFTFILQFGQGGLEASRISSFVQSERATTGIKQSDVEHQGAAATSSATKRNATKVHLELEQQ